MPIHLGPTEHIDQPENLMGSGSALRARLRTYMERQKDPQHFARDRDVHRTRLDEATGRSTLPNKSRS